MFCTGLFVGWFTVYCVSAKYDKWYGRVIRKDENYWVKNMYVMKLKGVREHGFYSSPADCSSQQSFCLTNTTSLT